MSSSTPPLPLTPAATVTQRDLSDSSLSPSDALEKIWNRAYDELKQVDPKLVGAYEGILSQELDGKNSSHKISDSKNSIEQADIIKRRSQMDQLMQAGLAKTEKEAKIKRNIGEVMQGALAMKDIVSLAIQTVPQAALAWTGVCLALQVSSLFIDISRTMLTSKALRKSYNAEQDESRWNRLCHH